jgi:Terminase RNaseH-like domain
MTERKIFARIETAPAKHSKEARAQSFVGRIATRGLYLPNGGIWVSDFVAELISFPSSSSHDDQVDACSVLFQSLANMYPGRVPTEPKQPKVLSFEPGQTTLTLTDLFNEEDRKYRRGGSRRI